MPKNDLIKRQREREQMFLQAGYDEATQTMQDFIKIALRDPRLVGKKPWGRKKLDMLDKVLKEIDDEYSDAFDPRKKESDIKRTEIDRILAEIYGDDVKPFEERHPDVKEINYNSPRKDWKK